MIAENIKLLLRLLWQPAVAMSGILDRGSLLFATLAVLMVTLALEFSVRLPAPPAPDAVTQSAQAEEMPIPRAHPRPALAFSFYTPLLVLAAIYVPGTLLVANLLGRLGPFGSVFSETTPHCSPARRWHGRPRRYLWCWQPGWLHCRCLVA